MRGALATTSALAFLPAVALAHPAHRIRVPVVQAVPISLPVVAASPDPTARAEVLHQIGLANALPKNLRRQRLLALAGAAQATADRLAYASALVSAGASSAARAALAQLGSLPLTANQTQQVAGLQSRLPTQDPALQAAAPPLILASAAPAAAAPPPFADPAGTLAFNTSVLQRDPANIQARQDAVRAALQLNDPATASQLANDGVTLDPNDPAGWLLSANVARQGNDTRVAMLDLKRAQELRAQQLGSDTGGISGNVLDSAMPAPAAPPVQSDNLAPLDAANSPAAPAPGSYRTAQTFYTNPFRDQTQASPATNQPPPAQPGVDPLTQQIDTTLATLQAQVAPQVAAYLDITGRSGASGTASLGSLAIPMEASFSPDGYGRLKFLVRPTWLYAGHGGTTPQDEASFGTLAFNVNQPTSTTIGYAGRGIDYQNDKGVALDADYAYSWAEADIGSTPLGFNQTNVVGGVTLTPRITDTIGLRLIAERRAVTDSLLSYAGTKDPRTGQDMGGVVRNRVFGQIELQTGKGYWFAGAGASKLYGENVKSNTEVEASGGVSYPVWATRIDEIRLGLNLIYFGFDRNLEYFSYGQGGYFSPQSYVAALIPVSYSERLGRLSYMLSGSGGLQTYRQHSSLWFPTNTTLQSELDARAATITSLNTSYGSQHEVGPSGSVHGEVQYDVTPNFNVGGAATFEHAGNFDQGEGLIYARYTFDGAR